jgi:hypothetical protein
LILLDILDGSSDHCIYWISAFDWFAVAVVVSSFFANHWRNLCYTYSHPSFYWYSTGFFIDLQGIKKPPINQRHQLLIQ